MDRSIPAGAARLLDFIYRTDAGSPPPACYVTIFGNRQNRLAKPITSMTLGDLIDAQKNWASKAWVKANWGAPTASSASGAAQFMRDTLIGLAKEMNLSGSQLFDPDFQDRLAYQLLKRRGYQQFMDGSITRIDFAKRLAMEWASFPVLTGCKGATRQLKRGQSYYAGDGLNKALVAPETVEGVLDEVRALGDGPAASPVPVQPAPAPVPAPETSREEITPQSPADQGLAGAGTPEIPREGISPSPGNGKAAIAVGLIGMLAAAVAGFWHHLTDLFWSIF